MTQEDKHDKYDDKVPDKFFYEKELLHNKIDLKIEPKLQKILDSIDSSKERHDTFIFSYNCPRHHDDMNKVTNKICIVQKIISKLSNSNNNEKEPSTYIKSSLTKYTTMLHDLCKDKETIEKFADLYNKETVKANKIKEKYGMKK